KRSNKKPDEGTDKLKVSTDKPEVSTAKPKEVEVSTAAEPKDGTSDESSAPTTVFRDDETIAEFLIKPLPKIDPKDKGNKVLEEEAESDAESEGVDEAERKFDHLAKDEEIARKVQEDWEAEKEMKNLAKEEARSLLASILAARLQEEERETFTVKERAKFLYDTIAAQKRFLAQQRVVAIRS
ncbi:hypothetical protein Tco_0248769, partial [Tanacetum coccineum]